MLLQRIAAFSPDNKYFATLSTDDDLFVWEIKSSKVLIDCKLNSSVYGVCSSLLWIPLQHKHTSPKKARLTRSQANENRLLALGTNKGDLILYNITSKNLFSHLRGRHSDSINDLSYCSETCSFFTASTDKSIAIWDIKSGRQKSKWIADDAPVSSICVLGKNSLLSASTSILLWDISKKVVLKKFSGHSTDIFKLLPVNADLSLKSCYFLSVAVGDSKINAWSLSSNDSEIPVACFVPSGQPQDIDISRVPSKPLILAVITEEGQLDLFEHTLNGNVNQLLHPKKSINLTSPNCKEPKTAAAISTKLSIDSESCIIACGTSKHNMVFNHIKVSLPTEESSSESLVSNEVLSDPRLSSLKVIKKLSINGLNSPKKTPKAARLKDSISRPQKTGSTTVRLNESSSEPSPVPVSKLPVEGARHSLKGRTNIKDSDITDPDSSVGMLLKGLKMHNTDLIDIVFQSSDIELIRTCVKSLPSHTLRDVLEELSRRLKHSERSSPTLAKWLKEMLRIHLKYLTETQDTLEVLNCIKEVVEAKRIQETISKMSALRGLLSLRVLIAASDKSNADSETSCIKS